MSQLEVLFHQVSFRYETATAPLLEGLDLHFPAGWTGVVGANGAGKTTLLRLASGELRPWQGHVQAPGRALYCPQRTDAAPAELATLLDSCDPDACQIRGRLGLETGWPQRWESLSHGERKRAQIGVALWRCPQVLAVDEPTNHLDAQARGLLIAGLRAFQGVGLLVSHDRELLDALCAQCVFVEPPRAVLRPGGYTEGAAQARAEQEHLRRERELARRERQRLEQEAVRRREEASRAHQRRSKRGLDPKDHDARFRRNRARISGKDGVGGKLLRQLDGRLEQAQHRQEKIRVEKNYALGIWVAGERSRRDFLFALPAGCLPLGEGRRLRFPDLAMRPADRIALTGPNGSGKSTLVRRILEVLDLPGERLVYLPQEIASGTAAEMVARARDLPADQLGRMMAAVSRLGSRPQRLLESGSPSPGEVRKILLAAGIARTPHLLLMDEPTNHLDLPSIECLEAALADCPCGLLLVSHDRPLLQRLTRTRWHLSPEGETGEVRLELRGLDFSGD